MVGLARGVRRPRVSQDLVDRINRTEIRHKGKIVAIDPVSGDYFMGATSMEAFRKARKRYPGRAFVFKRIGSRWTHRQAGGLGRVSG